MKSSYRSFNACSSKLGFLFGHRTIFPAVLLAVCLGLVRPASAQVVPSGDMGGFTLVAGGTASGYDIQYGHQKLAGMAAVVDVDTRRRFGFEGEARWLLYHQHNDVHVTDWLAGGRYHFSRGKFQYYGKGLVGVGQFQFPYNYAHGTYLVIAPGGGVDYRWRRKIGFRVADFEYQYWPQFTYGAMSTWGVSVGVQYHIF